MESAWRDSFLVNDGFYSLKPFETAFILLICALDTHLDDCAHGHVDAMTYVDVVLLVAQKEVVHDGSLMQLRQRGHVLHPVDAAGVHRVHRLPVHLRPLQVGHLERHRHTDKEFHKPARQSSSGRKDADVSVPRALCEGTEILKRSINAEMSVSESSDVQPKAPKPQTTQRHLNQREATNPRI